MPVRGWNLPKNGATQVEGSIVYGLSGALKEEVTFTNGAVQQSNFHDYQVIRQSELAVIQVKVMVTDNPPGGVGECGLPPVAPAIANAVARLTGKRLRHLPFTAERVKSALS